MRRQFQLISFLVVFVSTMFGQTDNKKLIIFHAGSLARPFAQIIQNFQEENPGVEILKEIAGSRACARKITDLGKECDILASADYEVIDNLLIPEYADWNLKFAANEMTIVYTKQSRLADQINQSNWHEILLKKEINFGRSDPNNDPCGYRTILTWKLSESYYNHPGLAEKLLKKNKEYVRPKEVDLLALLEAGELDYIFLYRSVAEQHKLPFLLLPDSINLKEGKCTELYKSVSVDVTGKKPGEYVTHMGTPMLYGVTIPHNAPNKTLANKFIHFLMNEDKGLKILRENGQPTVVPSLCESYNKLPEEFKPYALK